MEYPYTSAEMYPRLHFAQQNRYYCLLSISAAYVFGRRQAPPTPTPPLSPFLPILFHTKTLYHLMCPFKID